MNRFLATLFCWLFFGILLGTTVIEVIQVTENARSSQGHPIYVGDTSDLISVNLALMGHSGTKSPTVCITKTFKDYGLMTYNGGLFILFRDGRICLRSHRDSSSGCSKQPGSRPSTPTRNTPRSRPSTTPVVFMKDGIAIEKRPPKVPRSGLVSSDSTGSGPSSPNSLSSDISSHTSLELYASNSPSHSISNGIEQKESERERSTSLREQSSKDTFQVSLDSSAGSNRQRSRSQVTLKSLSDSKRKKKSLGQLETDSGECDSEVKSLASSDKTPSTGVKKRGSVKTLKLISTKKASPRSDPDSPRLDSPTSSDSPRSQDPIRSTGSSPRIALETSSSGSQHSPRENNFEKPTNRLLTSVSLCLDLVVGDEVFMFIPHSEGHHEELLKIYLADAGCASDLKLEQFRDLGEFAIVKIVPSLIQPEIRHPSRGKLRSVSLSDQFHPTK